MEKLNNYFDCHIFNCWIKIKYSNRREIFFFCPFCFLFFGPGINVYAFFCLFQYYIAARHMALAKAFPDTFIYEPHEPSSVS